MSLLPPDNQNPSALTTARRWTRTELENGFVALVLVFITIVGLLHTVSVSLFKIIRDIVRMK